MEEPVVYRVKLSYACYGVITLCDLVIEAAPIAKWAVGKHLKVLVSWVNMRGGTVERITPEKGQMKLF